MQTPPLSCLIEYVDVVTPKHMRTVVKVAMTRECTLTVHFLPGFVVLVDLEKAVEVGP